jgi:hypothetical protein
LLKVLLLSGIYIYPPKLNKNYFESKSIKINVTIPLWLKEEGEKKHVNFSQILQNGVKDYLQLQ